MHSPGSLVSRLLVVAAAALVAAAIAVPTVSATGHHHKTKSERRHHRTRPAGTMRYENPLYMAEDAGAADLIAGGRLQLGISRGSPEQVIDGWRHFGFQPEDGETDEVTDNRSSRARVFECLEATAEERDHRVDPGRKLLRALRLAA